MERKNKSKLFLKGLLITVAIVIFSIAGILGFIFYHLPSGSQLSSAILKPNKNANAKEPVVTGSTSANVASVTSEVAGVSDPTSVNPKSNEESAIQASKEGLRDLMDTNRPLSNFCSSLKNAKIGKMNNAEAGKAFSSSLDEANADPRAQSLKPIFRYIFRLPELQDLLTAVESASKNPEEGLTDKALFYGKAVTAFAAMRSHKEDFEAVADRSYLFYKLNVAVAQKPELLTDERLKKFCDDTESSFNNNVPVKFDQEKSNFERLLAELNVDQKSIGYDPNYKTSFDMQMGEGNLRLSGGWIEEVFSK
jgi:hypothetical protein